MCKEWELPGGGLTTRALLILGGSLSSCLGIQLGIQHPRAQLTRGLVVVAALDPDVPALSDARDQIKAKSWDSAAPTKTSFLPDIERASTVPEAHAAADEASQAVAPLGAASNEELLAEIRAMMPKAAGPAPEKVPIDLNGIKPTDLLIGAGSYLIVCVLAWQFTLNAGEYFAQHPMESSFYVVARLSSLARVIVIGMGALGAGVTGIAGVGQLLLAVQVAIGIAKGELDPTAERKLRPNEAKQGDVSKLIEMMKGGGKRIG